MSAIDTDRIRPLFPAAENVLYLDAGLQTPLSLPVKAELDRYYDAALAYAGPKADWLENVEAVRAKLAAFLGGRSEEVAFTKNTSEGLNICANGVHWEPGDNVVLLDTEHPNNAYAWLARRRDGLEVRLVPNDKAWADAETFAPHVDGRTRAIAVSQVMFHNGQLNDIASIAAFAASRGIAVVLDPMQAVGVVPLDVRTLGVTALASGTHKGLLIPQGLGFIWTGQPREELPPRYVANSSLASARPDFIPDGGPMEFLPTAKRFEIGNLNLPGIYALGGALDLITSVGVQNIAEHAYALGDQLIAGLDSLGVDLVGPRERAHRAPHVYVLALTNPDFLAYFADNGVRVSPERRGIRVSFGMYSTAEDVERFLGILATALDKALVVGETSCPG